jgi:hypothetical protein
VHASETSRRTGLETVAVVKPTSAEVIMFVLRSLAMTTALIIWVAPNVSLLFGQEPNPDYPIASTRESLHGLDGVLVQTAFTVDGQAAEASPSQEAARTFIESLLGDANVLSLGPGNASSRPAYLELDVGISTLIVGGEALGWAYVLRLQVLQEVCIKDLPRPSGCAVMPTWGTGTSQPTIVSGDLEITLYAQVADAVDRFLRDYVEANPT